MNHKKKLLRSLWVDPQSRLETLWALALACMLLATPGTVCTDSLPRTLPSWDQVPKDHP